MADGTQSNLNGMSLEKRIMAIALKRGLNGKERFRLNPEQGRNLLGGQVATSAFIYPCQLFPTGLGIDASGQDDDSGSRGSNYQKGPWKVLSMGRCWQVPGVIIYGSSDGYIQQMREWAAQEAVQYPNILGVFNLSEFEAWLDLVAEQGQPIRTVNDAPRLATPEAPIESRQLSLMGGLF